MSLRKKHEVKNSRSSLPNHMHLSFVDINILMLTINIINIYFSTWVGLFVLKS